MRARERGDFPKRRRRKLDGGTTCCVLLVQAMLGLPSLFSMVAWLADRAQAGKLAKLALPTVSEAAITRAVRRLDPKWLTEEMHRWVCELPVTAWSRLPSEIREVFRSDGSWFRATRKMAFAAWQDATHRTLKVVAPRSRAQVRFA